jgi:glycine/D-amino acid oxidase-like deaminating enzyme
VAYDVAVIGAGVHGCAAAAHLAARGAATVVIDQGAVAGGPTGRSSAVCRAYYSHPFLAAVARESLDILMNFEEWSQGGQSGYRRMGVLFLHPPEDAAGLVKNAAALAVIGTKVEVLDTAAVSSRFPVIDTFGLGLSAWEADAGPADPSSTTQGLLALARSRGAVASLYNKVNGIEQLRNGGVRLRCEKGDVEAGRLLIAAGPWTRGLTRHVGVDLPLTVERHFVTTNDWGTSQAITYGVADVTNGFYLMPEGPSMFGLGQLFDEPQADPDDFSESVTVAEQESMAAAASARIPTLASARALGGWASLYDVSPDWQPVIGEIAPHIFVDAGTSGHGFKLAPALGRHVADLILDETPAPGLAEFHPGRFAAGAEVKGGYGRARILG